MCNVLYVRVVNVNKWKGSLSLQNLTLVWCVYNFHVLWIKNINFIFTSHFIAAWWKRHFDTHIGRTANGNKKKMTQAFMDDYNFSFSLLLPSMRSARFFASTIQSILFSKLSHKVISLRSQKKTIIIASPLCFVRIAIIIGTGIEKRRP